ncbi:MAG: hypothetical protein JRI76_06435 [Deltaproteobacteria bacterium]|nr:hypothetical protein [Deltaproteobacteria bacterium]MBW2041660.1 hypothetical protein [Deltaproteobacteria bacterium]MBW2131118.1 hypothetical protein [Deltaproteobacteria bacterium]
MPEDKEKKDILKEVLSGLSEDPIPGIEELTELIYRAIPEETRASELEKLHTKFFKPKKLKKKTTHYLSEDIFETLGETREKLIEMLSEIPTMRISKSRIVNQALEMILKEFHEKGEKSRLVKKILKRSPEDK